MTAFTCIACKLLFHDAEEQRTHYKTDWHRYNLKQQVLQLPPITEATFNAKLNEYNKNKLAAATEVSFNCEACCKVFSTENAYENHIKSKKHLTSFEKAKRGKNPNKDSAEGKGQSVEPKSADGKAASTEKKGNSVHQATPKKESGSAAQATDQLDDFIEDMMGEDDDSDGWEDVDSDEEVDEDDEELGEGLPPETCLFCPHESTSIDDNLRHMLRSHSFFIPDIEYVTDIEAFLAYLGSKVGDGKVCLKCNEHSKQFLSIYACQLHMRDKGHCVLDYEGDAALEYGDFYDFSTTYPDNDSNDVDDELSSEMSELSVDPDTMELILPSGGRAGHRALRRYFDQSVPTSDVRPSIHHKALLSAMGSHYRASVCKVETRLSVATRQRMQKHENRDRFRRDLALSVKNNKCDANRFFRKQYMYAG